MIGVSLAVLLRNHDPNIPRKQYSWEEEDATDLDSDDEPPEPLH
jgi:hypothetical protein